MSEDDPDPVADDTDTRPPADATGTSSAADSSAGPQSVELPASVVAALERRVERTEFETIDEYVAFALELLLREVDRADDPDSDPHAGPDDPGDRDDSADGPDDAVADRLESLGYL